MTRPAENAVRAVSMAEMSGPQSSSFRTSASPRNITIGNPTAASIDDYARELEADKVGFGSIASVQQRPRHVGLTLDSRRIVAPQRTDASGQTRKTSN